MTPQSPARRRAACAGPIRSWHADTEAAKAAAKAKIEAELRLALKPQQDEEAGE